jgi:hypothetical protein
MTIRDWADKVMPLPPGVTQEDVDRVAIRLWLDKVLPIPRTFR